MAARHGRREAALAKKPEERPGEGRGDRLLASRLLRLDMLVQGQDEAVEGVKEQDDLDERPVRGRELIEPASSAIHQFAREIAHRAEEPLERDLGRAPLADDPVVKLVALLAERIGKGRARDKIEPLPLGWA
jgi:hypothetical protein